MTRKFLPSYPRPSVGTAETFQIRNTYRFTRLAKPEGSRSKSSSHAKNSQFVKLPNPSTRLGIPNIAHELEDSANIGTQMGSPKAFQSPKSRRTTVLSEVSSRSRISSEVGSLAFTESVDSDSSSATGDDDTNESGSHFTADDPSASRPSSDSSGSTVYYDTGDEIQTYRS